MKQIVINKWLKTISLAYVLSTTLFAGSVSSFAATDISRKLIHNDAVIQLSAQENTSSYYPQPDKDPYKEPAELLTVQTKTASITSNDMIGLNTKGTNVLRIKDGVLYIDFNGKGSTPMDAKHASNYEKLGFTKDMLEGTQFKQHIQWKRIYNRLQPKSTQNQWSVTETHGVSTAETKEFAYSVGAEVGATLDGITGKITGNISKKFSTTTTITSQTSHTVTDTFPAKPENYPYNDYRVAVYQKQEAYTIIPGAKLKQAMVNLANALDTSIENVSVASFTYTTDELRPIVTPNQ
ncbi:hypothetical protein FA950_29475 [Bacillus thuringiensis]|uniref:hypothetical protein n=1 Tax=Bacillus thuringiensis TaxID=1428 RepID=UPI0010ABEECB|nr:hypothetical protein [Bacillus thuringiensis]TJZ99926.1 hypothetical protein FA950_29475 [Bacillus thuringiensis]